MRRSVRLSLSNKGALAFVSVLLLCGSAGSADVESILQQMDEALRPGEDMRARVEFTLSNPIGETVRWQAQYFRHGGENPRSRFVFTDPVDRRGIELVVKRVPDGLDKLELYLPALRRTRTIRLPFRGTSFLHTDFNYADLGFVELESQRHELSGEETIGDRACYKVESFPKETGWYERIVRFIDKENYLPVRTEYYFDSEEAPYKVKRLEEIRTIDSYPTPTVVEMRTIPEQTWTHLHFTNVEYDTSLPEEATQGFSRRSAPREPGREK